MIGFGTLSTPKIAALVIDQALCPVAIITSKTFSSMLNPRASTFSVRELPSASNEQESRHGISGIAAKKRGSGNVKVLADGEVASVHQVITHLPQSIMMAS